MRLHAIVLAAGKGTRMNSDTPKVLHEAAGRTLLEWGLHAVGGADDVVVVVGHGSDLVRSAMPSDVRSVVQEPQLGTGHATGVALAAMNLEPSDLVVVIPGDMPLIEKVSIDALVDAHAGSSVSASVLTAIVDQPAGYGRIVRNNDGAVVAIVEERDASLEQRVINEINTSVYVFEAGLLSDALGDLGNNNSQGEQYLTDVVGVLTDRGMRVGGVVADPEAARGVNSHIDLATVSAALRRRINRRWMEAGVRMHDPDRVYVDATVILAPGAEIYPDVHLEGRTVVGREAIIGPGVFARDSDIGVASRVMYAVLSGADVGNGAEVGPYTHLRPGTRLGEGVKTGSFVEVKQSVVGAGSKIAHLSYVGDATVGEEVNIGAGTITVNYDGYAKHRTVIGDRAHVGSATMLVAPVEVGDDAITGAGSVITKNVKEGALGVERSPQREIPGYAARRKLRANQEPS